MKNNLFILMLILTVSIVIIITKISIKTNCESFAASNASNSPNFDPDFDKFWKEHQPLYHIPGYSSAPALKLVSSRNDREYGYIIISGEVQNMSESPQSNIMAMVIFRDRNGTFIKMGQSLLKYNPILSAQTAPFRVIETDNPEIKKYDLSFHFLSGEEIPCEKKEEKKTRSGGKRKK